MTLEPLASLASLVFQVLMDQKAKGDNRAHLASEVKKVLWEILVTKDSWETEDSQEKRVIKALLVHLDPKLLSKETSGSLESRDFQDHKELWGIQDQKAIKESLAHKDQKVKMASQVMTVREGRKESLVFQGLMVQGDIQDLQDPMGCQGKWVHRGPLPCIMGFW